MPATPDMERKAKVSIIIVNYEGARYTLDCIHSLKHHPPARPHEIIIVDNNSSQGEAQMLKATLADCRVVALEENRGFGSANNAGASRASGDLLLFLNNDTLVHSDVVTPLAQYVEEHPACGAVGPALQYEDGSFQLSYGAFPSLFNEWKAKRSGSRGESPAPHTIDWVTGAAIMVRTSVFRQVGGFDENYFMYFEDADLCLRISRSGFTIDRLPEVVLTHLGGRSYDEKNTRIRYEYRKSQLRFYAKFRPLPDRAGLRLYLFFKYIVRLILAPHKMESTRIIGLLFRRHS